MCNLWHHYVSYVTFCRATLIYLTWLFKVLEGKVLITIACVQGPDKCYFLNEDRRHSNAWRNPFPLNFQHKLVLFSENPACMKFQNLSLLTSYFACNVWTPLGFASCLMTCLKTSSKHAFENKYYALTYWILPLNSIIWGSWYVILDGIF